MTTVKALFFSREDQLVYITEVDKGEGVYGDKWADVSRVLAVTSLFRHNIEADYLIIENRRFNLHPESESEFKIVYGKPPSAYEEPEGYI